MPELAATCGGCGLLCDDLVAHVEDGRLAPLDRACPKGAAWFTARTDDRSPLARVDGRECRLDVALDAAAEILTEARLPLVHGLGDTSCEAQREAVALAEALGAVIDPSGPLADGGTSAALQSVGASTALLGDLRDRAELVVCWRADPLTTHPRLLERLRLEPGARGARTLVVVGDPASATAAVADVVIALDPGRDLEALWTLRALVREAPLTTDPALPMAALGDLARSLADVRVAAVLHDGGLARGRGGPRAVTALAALVRELFAITHPVTVQLRTAGNAAGAEDVLTWQSGYPTAVSYASGAPRFDPGASGTQALLARGAVDAALVVASDPLGLLDDAAAAHLRAIPVVSIAACETATAALARVAIRPAAAGVQRAGTAHRLDGLPVPLHALVADERPGDDEVLAGLAARIASARR